MIPPPGPISPIAQGPPDAQSNACDGGATINEVVIAMTVAIVPNKNLLTVTSRNFVTLNC